jgi:hypothetical protein
LINGFWILAMTGAFFGYSQITTLTSKYTKLFM